ncbi:hypothetical protein [Labrenzia sp. THAF82]|uniref:hypothetical protein n=1 Tax=Labrenzia sp. THAF82 TaxID=2587861 RepID=UPI001268C675|nr:hypothetical protein [Labrenzia sp. THAF82]
MIQPECVSKLVNVREQTQASATYLSRFTHKGIIRVETDDAFGNTRRRQLRYAKTITYVTNYVVGINVVIEIEANFLRIE